MSGLTKEVIHKLPAFMPGEGPAAVLKKYPYLRTIHKLSSNENQLGPSPKAVAAIRDAAARLNEYPDGRASRLCAALGEFYDISPEHLFVTSGATGSLELVADVFVCPGDEAIFCWPTYLPYRRYVQRQNGIPVEVPLDSELRFDLGAMERAITDRTKLIMICNPNNPTGTAVPRDELERFLRNVPEHIIVMLDEAYIEFSRDGADASLYRLVLELPNLVVLRTFSKLYGLAGERVGYTFSGKEVHDLLSKSATFFTATALGIEAAIAALSDQEFVKKTLATIHEGRRYLTREFEALGFRVYESETNFLYIDTGFDAMSFAEALKAHGIVIRGNFELSRITIGTPEQNRLLVEAAKEIVEGDGVTKREGA
jgi:histidinol-phosphate aminotransferase